MERALANHHKLGNVPLKFDVQNSYAVELAETGKIELASEVIKPVTASPFALYYPNWLETKKEIEEKSRRSLVSIGGSDITEPTTETAPEETTSRVLEFPRKEKAGGYKEPEPREPQEPVPTPYSDYIQSEFRVHEKVEDWMHGSATPDDFGTLMYALYEAGDEVERELIISRTIDSTFLLTDEGKEAKEKWRERIISKMKK